MHPARNIGTQCQTAGLANGCFLEVGFMHPASISREACGWFLVSGGSAWWMCDLYLTSDWEQSVPMLLEGLPEQGLFFHFDLQRSNQGISGLFDFAFPIEEKRLLADGFHLPSPDTPPRRPHRHSLCRRQP